MFLYAFRELLCSLILSYVCFIFHFQEKAISIWESKDFFIELDPLPGGVEAVKEMAKMEKYVSKVPSTLLIGEHIRYNIMGTSTRVVHSVP